jgi:hypothetical protein
MFFLHSCGSCHGPVVCTYQLPLAPFSS